MGKVIGTTGADAKEKEIEQQALTTSVPILADYARLNFLARTTKGLFPKFVPSRENLEELIKNFDREQGAVPLTSKDPLRKPVGDVVKLEGFIDYPVEEDWKINDPTWIQRKKALNYALLTHRGRQLGAMELTA